GGRRRPVAADRRDRRGSAAPRRDQAPLGGRSTPRGARRVRGLPPVGGGGRPRDERRRRSLPVATDPSTSRRPGNRVAGDRSCRRNVMIDQKLDERYARALRE